MEPLAVRLIEDAVVYPTIRVASQPDKLLMGVFDADGYVEGTVLDRRSGEQGAPVPRELFGEVTDSAEPEAIYAGPLYFHFGHFLLESLARTWYAAQHPELPLVWAGAHSWAGVELKPWQTEMLELLGVTNPTRVVACPTRFARLHVPDIGYRYDDRFHPDHAAFLGRYEGPAQVRGRRLWLSRSGIKSDVRDLNAEPTERRLAAAGWTVAHPEALSVREQLDELSRAETVAGEEGSAFHTLVLLKDVSAKKFRVLRRHGREHGNMHTIGDAREVDQSFHSVGQQLVLRAEGRAVSKISPSSAATLDVLRVKVPKIGADPSDATDALVARVVSELRPRRLLDVDATGSGVVAASGAPVRVAVSRRFSFDPRALATTAATFYELGLQQYADHFHADRDPFDVIRIAGSGLGEVMESFRVSKRLADERTVWVLGTGNVAARAALAVRLMHPGYRAGRLLVQRTIVFVVRRVPGEPTDEAGLAALTAAELKKHVRWVGPTTLHRLRRWRAEADSLPPEPSDVSPPGPPPGPADPG